MDFTGAMFDAENCSICCKKFITPRYLLCKHSFCHSCLYSYIVHQCKSMESSFGFHCPICRVYIPKTRDPSNPEDWTKCFPENFVLEKYVHSSDQRFCEAFYAIAKKKTQHAFVLTATKNCAGTAQNTPTEDNQHATIK